MPKRVKTVTEKAGTPQPSPTPAKSALEIFVAVKRAQKEARDRVLKESGVNRSEWPRIKDLALVEMGNDTEREVNGSRVQVIETPKYLSRKPEKAMFSEQSLIVSEAR